MKKLIILGKFYIVVEYGKDYLNIKANELKDGKVIIKSNHILFFLFQFLPLFLYVKKNKIIPNSL